MKEKDFKQGRRGGGDVHILELKKEIYKIIKTSLEENPDGSVSYNWIVNLDRFTEIFFKRLEAFINTHTKQIKAIEENIDYAKFEIQEQRIEGLEKLLQKLIKICIPYFDGKEAPVMEGWIEKLKNKEG